MTTPSADTGHRTRITSTEVLAAGGVVAMGAAFLLSPHGIEDGPVICPFRRLTGLPCPGCGLTRSWVYAAHGWWRESFASHPFGMLVVAAVLALVVVSVAARVRRSAPPDIEHLVRNRYVYGLGAIWLAFAAVRIGYSL